MMKNKTIGSTVCLTPNSKSPLTNEELKAHILKEIKRLSLLKNPSPETLDDIKDLSAAAKFLDENNGISWKESKVEFLEDLCAAQEASEEFKRTGEFYSWEEVKKQLCLGNE